MFWAFVTENLWKKNVAEVHWHLPRNKKTHLVQCHGNENFFRCLAGRSPRFGNSHGCSTGKGSFSQGLQQRSRVKKAPKALAIVGASLLSGRQEGIGGMAAGSKILLCLSLLVSCFGSQHTYPAPCHDKARSCHPDDYLLHVRKTWSIFFERCDRLRAVCLLQLLFGEPPEPPPSPLEQVSDSPGGRIKRSECKVR